MPSRLPSDSPAESSASVLVIGGGLAGLAAAVALAPLGYRVTIVEARTRLGGRAGSFPDPASGQLVDACQHVTMGCCTAFAEFCRTVGIDRLLAPQPVLEFMTPDRRVSRFAADPWPAPLHLGRALLAAHYLTPAEKLRIAYGFAAMLAEPPEADPPLDFWLRNHRQTRRTIDRFWGVVLVSALNETVDRAGFKYARKVFRDAFVADRAGFTVHVPTVPLGEFYGPVLRKWLAAHGVTVRENAAVRRLEVDSGAVARAVLRDGTALAADHYVLAVPFDRVLDLLPDELAADPFFAGVRHLEPSPITSVHLWYDRPVLDRPHVVLVDCLGQWVFSRGEVAPGEHYVQVVISAARSLRGLGREAIGGQVLAELARLFPAARAATVLRSRVITEHAATFSPTPGVDRYRPPQATPVANLVLAGDWTRTGWPATMEGAVRSGRLAAAAIRARTGR